MAGKIKKGFGGTPYESGDGRKEAKKTRKRLRKKPGGRNLEFWRKR